MILAVTLAFVVAATIVLAAWRRLGRMIFAVALAPLVFAFVAIAVQVPSVLDQDVPEARWQWVSQLSMSVSFRLDGVAVAMGLLVTGIGLVVVVYAWDYFHHDPSPDRVARFAGFFTLFAGAMLGLVLAGDVWTLFVGWELTSVLSFLLIGLDDHLASARTAALRALLVTGAGGLAMLGGLICLVHEARTSDLQTLLERAPTSTTAQVGLVLVLVGAFAKSAQFPLHFWLPGAMAAPTPVSAFLHSATMVKAGVVVVARFAPAFATVVWWRPTLLAVGGTTMLLGGVAALRRNDAKQSLAFGTVSQLGFLVVLFGLGEPQVTAAGVAWLAAHALFKSGLFLTIGAVEHATGSRDLRRLSGVGRSLPILAVASGLCTLSMIGLPPLLGFAAKESALASLIDTDTGWSRVGLLIVIVGSILTAAYSFRLWWAMFATKRPVSTGAQADDGRAHVHHPPNWGLTGPVCLLAAVSLAAGIVATPLASRLTVAADSLDQAAHLHLGLWSGLHLPLLYSALIVGIGLVLGVAVLRRPLPAASGATYGERAYGRTYTGLLDGARRVTAVSQSGSLPGYVAVIFSVIVLVTGIALARGAGADVHGAVLADSAMQAVVALLAVAISIAVVVARRRFVSVLLLGGVGQALTVIFLMYGAPDLALTQFMIETMTIVAFVLVLRHLPRDFAKPPSWAPRLLRIGVAVASGVAVAWFALAAGSTDRPTDVATAMEQLSLPAAGGRNVVNVAVVDFRGVDTMFEITVFGIAALGVANLVRAATRTVGAPRPSRLARIGAHSMVFVQVTRMIFHVTLLVSVYVALRGHNAPGGGFAGGLIAASAFVFRLLAGGGSDDRTRVAKVPPVALIGVGMLLAIGSGLTALALGNEFLETAIVHVHVPLVGDVKLVSAAVFDFGVYLLVIGVTITMLNSLASRTHAGGGLADAGGG